MHTYIFSNPNMLLAVKISRCHCTHDKPCSSQITTVGCTVAACSYCTLFHTCRNGLKHALNDGKWRNRSFTNTQLGCIITSKTCLRNTYFIFSHRRRRDSSTCIFNKLFKLGTNCGFGAAKMTDVGWKRQDKIRLIVYVLIAAKVWARRAF